ncbi:MAG: transposase [Myxococcota bacterium]
MRHGRKSKSKTINGFKKHVAVDLDEGLFLAATARPANEREHAAELELRRDVERLGKVSELHADRGYLPGSWLPELHREGKSAVSKPWMTSSARFAKADFTFDFERNEVQCAAGQTTAIRERPSGRAASFLGKICCDCPLHDDCLPAGKRQGRQINLHPNEEFLQHLRGLTRTPEGRALQRQRVTVEHRLAHHCRRQGARARYIGVRKNTFDCRRIAAVENLHVIDRLAA